MWVAGVDSCRAGWCVVLWESEQGLERMHILPELSAVFIRSEQPTFVGIDMVIGVADVAERGGRPCDRAARKVLGWPRSSSVFSPPCRATLACTTYAEALAVNRASGPDEVGLSKQAFNLFPKIREVDQLLTPSLQSRMREVHPELSFQVMHAGEPLMASKHTEAGQQQRLALLREQGFSMVPKHVTERPRGVQVDDVLDAYAVCWSARRLALGQAKHVPEKVIYDSRGLAMMIWW